MNIEHVDSYYAATANQSTDFPAMTGSLSADICVIGGGLTGLSTAIELQEAGYRVVLLEAKKVGWGASGRSGGQMIFGYGCSQSKLKSLLGSNEAKLLWDASLDGIELIRQRVKKYNIDCDLVQGHVHVALKPRQMRELESWCQELKAYDYQSVSLWDQEKTRQMIASERYRGGLYDSNSGHLHPLNYTLGLARAAKEVGVQLFEKTQVTQITPGKKVVVKTAKGDVTANFCVLAGNAYLSGVMPSIESSIMPVGTYITATEPLDESLCKKLIVDNVAVADMNFVLDYFRRSQDNRLLFGGRVSYSTLEPANLQGAMKSRLVNVFPQLQPVKIDYTWGGYVAITVNRAPHFGRTDDNIYFAQGFSGHGIAATGLAGKLIAESIRGQSETFDVFARLKHQRFPGGRLLRTPALVMAMAWFRLLDLLP